MMTKKEFNDFVKSFGKNPGEYTEEEITKIGIAHKEQLLRCDKDWTALASELGLTQNGEAFRKWILYKRYALGSVTKNPKILDDKTVDEVTKEDVSNSLTKQKEDLFIERTKLRDTYSTYRRGMREEARIQSFNASLVDAIHDLAELPHVEPKVASVNSNTEMVLGLSDLHLGIEFENSYNSYNVGIAKQRMTTIAEQVIKYCKLYNVKRLTVLNLGDMISGLIHETLRLEQEMDVTEQIAMASRMIAELLNQLQQAAPEVIYRSVVDNHSRATADKNQHIEKENFNKIVDLLVESSFTYAKTNITFPKDNLDDGVGMFKLLNGKNMMFTHGHQDKKSTVVQDMVGLTREWVDYIFMAHYHNGSEHTFQNAKLYVNGSIVGTDTYAYGRRLFSEPEQKALVFDGNNVIDINIKL